MTTTESIAARPAVAQTQSGRIDAVDLARGLALIGMVAVHLVVDLELLGLAPPGSARQGLWPNVARLVAGSFLFLAGVSLWLAHGDGIRWRGFARRLLRLVAAAAAISLTTWLAMPDRFVHFGILHSIAVCSAISLAFLRLPAGVTLGAAALVLLAPDHLRDPAFDAPWFWWTGLSASPPPSIDFEPVLPWLAPCLAGVACARLAGRAGLWRRLETWRPDAAGARLLARAGRHSLILYLVHQPILLALLFPLALILR